MSMNLESREAAAKEAFPISASSPFLHNPNPLINARSSIPKFPNSRSTPLTSSPSRRSLLLHTATAPSKFELFSSPVSVQSPLFAGEEEKFDWYSQWYPVMPVCDLDKRVPLAKKVLGIDIVVWWDRNSNSWKVFDDMCPHRLAPLSEGRIDQLGRLQCVYHGWCFDGSGNCKLIPQAPPDGPPVHANKRACVAAYPTILHHEIVWFWPNSDPQYRDIFEKKKPPFIPELDDPSFTKLMGNRDLPYGYEVLAQNVMDPAHIPYSHYGLMQAPPPKVKRDREGGAPLELVVEKLDMDGFIAKMEFGGGRFIAPCTFSFLSDPLPPANHGNGSVSSASNTKKPLAQRRTGLVFMCIPVSPGHSRLIWAFPRNFGIWLDKIVPRWMFHVGFNLVLDSDLYLLHVEDRKINEIGTRNWQEECFVPTKSDALVVGFRKWFKRYTDSEVNWRGKYTNNDLPPTPPREQLMGRYWTHVVNCSSCSSAYKSLNALETILQVIAVGLAAGAVAAATHGVISTAARTKLAISATVCFAASRWLAHFVYKNFHYHGYNHAFR